MLTKYIFLGFIELAVELLLYHSTDMSTGAHYILRMNLHGGAWLSKVTQEMHVNEDVSAEKSIVLGKTRLETNRLIKLFDPDQAHGGFSVKVKVKPDYTGLSFSKAGEEHDPILAVKDHTSQGNQDDQLYK